MLEQGLLTKIAVADDFPDGRCVTSTLAPAPVTDMTQRKRAEAAERESESLRAVANLAFSAAHEINNPLSVITCQLHFMAKEQPGSPRVASIEEAARRIQDIVSQMLQTMRLEDRAAS
jgi:signal transduction histidine kinase